MAFLTIFSVMHANLRYVIFLSLPQKLSAAPVAGAEPYHCDIFAT